MKNFFDYLWITSTVFAFTLLAIVGCETWDAIRTAAVTPQPDGETPIEKIAEGTADAVTNPANPLAWDKILAGVVAIAAAAFAAWRGKKALAARKAARS